ncbi:bifunctional folylpolyglutamate synthase/dihydrofolate synthase [Campylobacter sp. faydin G-105]|uniref:Mur ligase family protein n=1 Tax=Campylobacter anatolicus TaxID=2829105 RepID=UPI001B90DDE0|nr:Mur ligase family protein [Campylobacter anatolicus]MBR8462130.1 bifunctional folylpolyglutamate synthase/dihydrofolate synthase [Campylobacter anatolicus]
MKLEQFLQDKPLFYKEIDYTRMPRAWASIKLNLKPFKIIHIIGTNGKGSTGRFLAQILRLNGVSVGHYTSPHIFKFNERFWLNGEIVSDELLQDTHERLLSMLSDEFRVKTSYFEYATLLAALLFESCDYFICEAGMGGELDATNVFDKCLSIFTPIGIDHISTLGNTLEAISATKFKAMCDTALLNDDMNETSVKIAFNIAKSLGSNLKFASETLNDNDKKQIKIYADKFDLADFLHSNLTLASAAAKILLEKLDISNLTDLDLRGRCEKIASNLYVDVGHNELGAVAIVSKFSSNEFKDKKLTLIYNTFMDKDFHAVLSVLKPILKQVLIYHYDCDGRELGGKNLIKALDKLGIIYRKFDNSDMSEILVKNSDEIYLAFGSFYLVEAFLRDYYAGKGL